MCNHGNPIQTLSPQKKSATGEPAGRTESPQIDFEDEKGSLHKTSRNRRSGEWKGLLREGDENKDTVTLLRSSMAADVNAQDKTHRRVGRTEQSLSPRPTAQKKRRRPEERQDKKATVGAPRRLLQFAVRDAVAISRPSNSTGDPSLKRLRSVVSTSTGVISVKERPLRIRPLSDLGNSMSVAIKAVAEAVKDASKVRTSGNVFDRLGRYAHVSNTVNHQEEYGGVVEDGGEFNDEREDFHLAYHPRNDSSRQQDGNLSSFHEDTAMDSDMGYESYDGEGYEDVDEMRRGATVISQSGTSGGNWVDNSLMFQYAPDSADERVNRRHKELDEVAAMPNTSVKIASSVNMNTRKPSKYQEVREASEMDDRILIQNSDTATSKSVMWSIKETNNPVVSVNGNAKPDTNLEKESQKTQTPTGLYSAGPIMEDADTRTIFVSNVHFAANKDSLSRHFNKFGEVLKVIILIDPSTGQPKGSAYIEFMRKEAAELALSLDGTSFMSRILKIVRKSSAQPESSVVTWPRIASVFGGPRFGRIPFARGIPNSYMARTPFKPGARSFQWKRDAQSTVPETSGQASNSTVPTLTRSLTYVRAEPKTNGSSGTA